MHGYLLLQHAKLDIFNYLMFLNSGKIYRQLEKTTKDAKKYVLIPSMAMGLKDCVGFLPTASFCERCNSVAKEVMTDAYTLMGEEALEMLAVLQMNRVFMEHMRVKSMLEKQQFGMPLVELDEQI